MVLLELIDGKKSGSDVLVLVTANHEPLTFTEWLYLGMHYLNSESSYYPVSEGNRGPCLLLEALIELSHGVKFEDVIQRFGLARKNSRLLIEDRRKVKQARQSTYLHELL